MTAVSTTFSMCFPQFLWFSKYVSKLCFYHNSEFPVPKSTLTLCNRCIHLQAMKESSTQFHGHLVILQFLLCLVTDLLSGHDIPLYSLCVRNLFT